MGYRDGHAVLWSGSANSVIDLTPSGYIFSYGKYISGIQQAGYGQSNNDSNIHALLWSGSAESVIDLHPTSGIYYESRAYGCNGDQQVGYGIGSESSPFYGNQHALLWSGSAESVVDLNSGFTSYARGTNGTQQVGYGSSYLGSSTHALLWNGTSSSVVDLNPSGFLYSLAYGISGTQQVGFGSGSSTGNKEHALLWSGSAESAIDLNPMGFDSSDAEDTNGVQQVGCGQVPGNVYDYHALLWSGSAASAVDLGQFLPNGFTSSRAYSIDTQGNIAGSAVISGIYHAILWQPVPEPGTFVMLGMGALSLLCFWRRKRAG